MQFLKDVALARLLDDSSYSTLNTMVYLSHVEIVNHFHQDHEYLEQLFTILSSDEAAERKRDVILFLSELCQTAKSLQTPDRTLFYKSLGQHGLFAIFEYTLTESDLNIRLAVSSILYNILDHDPSLVRSFCLAQLKEQQVPLVGLIIDRFFQENDSGLQLQLTEILRSILDTNCNQFVQTTVDQQHQLHRLPQSKEELELNTEFLARFYEKYAQRLFSPIINLAPSFVQLTGI